MANKKWNSEELNNMRILRTSSISRNTINMLKINTHNSLKHEMKKLEIMYNLIKRGCKCYSETPFKDFSGIPDVFNISESSVVEVVVSETKESIEKKRKKYPSELYLEVVEVKK